METRPDIAIPGPTIDKSLEEREIEPKTLYHPNPERRQKIPSFMSKFTEQAGINLRKPSIPTDNNLTADPEPEPKLNPLLDMQIDSSLSSQADPYSELEQKPSLGKERFDRGDLRNVVIEKGRGLNITDLRKPDVPSDDNTEIDTRPEKNPGTLSDEHTHDYNDWSNIILKGIGETAITDSSELDRKSKLESNKESFARYNTEELSNVLLHKKPKFDVGEPS